MTDADRYRLLDSGGGRKLEQVGAVRLERQAAAAIWPRRLPAAEWEQARAVHVRSKRGGGHWDFRRRVPGAWPVRHGGLTLEVRPTPFGHLGLFPEHAAQWDWLRRRVAAAGGAPRVLNLFAYTGGATLVLAAAGAHACHVDAARPVVDRARHNAEVNGLADRPVRWIVDDCLAFLGREARRGRRYEGLLLDPPSYGRGSGRQVFKIERDLPALLDAARAVLVERPALVLLSCHTPGFTPTVLGNLLREAVPQDATFEEGEMTLVEEAGGRRLPAGAFARCACP